MNCQVQVLSMRFWSWWNMMDLRCSPPPEQTACGMLIVIISCVRSSVIWSYRRKNAFQHSWTCLGADLHVISLLGQNSWIVYKQPFVIFLHVDVLVQVGIGTWYKRITFEPSKWYSKWQLISLCACDIFIEVDSEGRFKTQDMGKRKTRKWYLKPNWISGQPELKSTDLSVIGKYLRWKSQAVLGRISRNL